MAEDRPEYESGGRPPWVEEEEDVRPSDETRGRGRFDRFATVVDRFVSSSRWFAGPVVGVILWAVWGPFAGFSETWQLVINTATTILTFLLVGLAANAESRNTKAMHLKLNALAEGVADLMQDKTGEDRAQDARELREAVGLEHEASS